MNLVAGQGYQLDVLGSESGVGSMIDPYIFIESSGSFDYDDDSGSGFEAHLEFVAVDTGEHVITVGTYDSGTYVLAFDYL